MDHQYYILSPKHTSRADSWITLWRTNRSGYCWRLDWAGKYSLNEAKEICADTNGDCVYVLCDLVDQWKANAIYDRLNIEVLPNDRQTQMAFQLDSKVMKSAKTRTV